MTLDGRKWFDRSQPQTLQIATWLLYINGFFALVDLVDERGWLRLLTIVKEPFGWPVALAVVACYVGGGWLMANDRKAGYYLAIAGAFSPFLLRFWVYNGTGVSMWDRLTGGRLISFIFDVALCALLLHPQSRNHQRVWFK